MVLSACAAAPAPAPQSVSTSEPGATVVFTKGYQARLMVSGSQTYMTSSDGTCATLAAQVYMTFTTGGHKTIRVADGAPVYVYGLTRFFYTSSMTPAVTVSSKTCAGGASFVPEQGHTYTVTQKAQLDQQQCPFEVVDQATGVAVSTLKPAPELESCGGA